MEAFSDKVKEICGIYINASEAALEGTHVYSTDEKMGIHAREHKNPSIQMKKGNPEKIDPEYIRHGTSGIIVSRDVATGKIIEPMVQPTRTEEDFAKHIRDVVNLNPDDKNIFVTDNLNTHKSESLVRFVAEVEGIPASELGIKDRKGILKSMATRETFLSDTSHKIQFVYTPKHCSWLNQIECWFGIITRRLLNRRASFISVSDLEQKIKAFIDYYNQYLMKPFQWNYKGKILKV
jgi:transposase